MTGFGIVNLKELLEQVGEDRTKEILSRFSCPMNKDVENFIRGKAIEFSRQGIAQTQLVFASYKEETVLVGYFTLATKVLVIPKKNLKSSQWAKRVRRFSTDGAASEEHDFNFVIPAPLIGQLGKNFTNDYNKLISGDELLKLATDKVRETQGIIGGKFVYLECEDKWQLTNFYEANGFVQFGHRDLDRDERDTQSGNYLVQLLKYLK